MDSVGAVSKGVQLRPPTELVWSLCGYFVCLPLFLLALQCLTNLSQTRRNWDQTQAWDRHRGRGRSGIRTKPRHEIVIEAEDAARFIRSPNVKHEAVVESKDAAEINDSEKTLNMEPRTHHREKADRQQARRPTDVHGAWKTRGHSRRRRDLTLLMLR